MARTANIVEIMLYISQQMKCTLQTSCVIRVALNVAAAPEIDVSCASARHRKEKARGLAVLHKRKTTFPISRPWGRLLLAPRREAPRPRGDGAAVAEDGGDEVRLRLRRDAVLERG